MEDASLSEVPGSDEWYNTLGENVPEFRYEIKANRRTMQKELVPNIKYHKDVNHMTS